jgi:hypothetical protein
MKKPVLLLVVLVALVGFAFFYSKKRDNRVNSARLEGAPMRSLLLPKLATGEVRKIRLHEDKTQVNLAVEGDRWVLQERSGYPAAFDKIKQVVQGLSELKILGKTPVGKTALPELYLQPPDEAEPGRSGLLVELLNDKGEALASFVAGRGVESSGGASSGNFMGGPGEQRFVRIPADKDTAWIVSAESMGELTPDAAQWIDKSFLNVANIKSVEVTFKDAANSWKAEKKDKASAFEFAGAPSGEALDTAKASALDTVLSGATFTDVLPKDKATPDFMKDAVTAKLLTFDGFLYDCRILEKKEGGPEAEPKYFLTVSVSAELAKERKPEPEEKPEDKKTKDEAFAAEKKTLEDKLAKEKQFSGWVYEVSSYAVDALLAKRSTLLRAPSAPEATPAGGAPTSGLPSIQMPSVAPARPPISVTTPPVSLETGASAKPAEAKPKSE